MVSGIYEDIYDGKLYKFYVENNGLLNYLENILFIFNIDGVFVFKLSNVFIWFIYLIVNELFYYEERKYVVSSFVVWKLEIINGNFFEIFY